MVCNRRSRSNREHGITDFLESGGLCRAIARAERIEDGMWSMQFSMLSTAPAIYVNTMWRSAF